MRGEVPAREYLRQWLDRAAEEGKRLARTYAAILVEPGRHIGVAAAGASWVFAPALIVGYSLLAAVLLWLAWPTTAETFGLASGLELRRVNVVAVFLGSVVFHVALAGATYAALRLLARQRAAWLTVLNCVAVAVVPCSAGLLAAWLVVYVYAPMAVLVLGFAALAAVGFFIEALRSQFNLTAGWTLYAVPLALVVALLAAILFLLAVFGGHDEPPARTPPVISVRTL